MYVNIFEMRETNNLNLDFSRDESCASQHLTFSRLENRPVTHRREIKQETREIFTFFSIWE